MRLPPICTAGWGHPALHRYKPNHHPVGAGQAPPATVCYNEYNGLACRHGYYAARCNHPDITIYRVNRTERSRPFPTNLPGIGALPIIAYLPVIRREGFRPLLAALQRLQSYGLVCCNSRIYSPHPARSAPPSPQGGRLFRRGGVTPPYTALYKNMPAPRAYPI